MHSGTVDGDDEGRYTSLANGFWIDMDGKRLYYAGDTALTMEMQLLKGQVDVALLPIGDNFTMGPADAARAVDFIGPRVVIPMHYDTWDPSRRIRRNSGPRSAGRAEVVTLQPGRATTSERPVSERRRGLAADPGRR
jgi:L-ascorbate metabolism protein UlaG (beta-lactamase superfamily)